MAEGRLLFTSRLDPLLIEVNHSPSMAIKGAAPAEVKAKCAVLRTALRLGSVPLAPHQWHEAFGVGGACSVQARGRVCPLSRGS